MIGPSGSAEVAASMPRGPCGPARADVETICTEAERRGRTAAASQQRLRDAKLQLTEAIQQREQHARVRDRRQLNEAKEAARSDYHAAMVRATDRNQVESAIAAWLGEINRLNRQARDAERRADEFARRTAELDGALPGIELAADAARIAAESAEAACLEARRTLAACEEQAERRAQAHVTRAAGVRSSAVATTSSGPTTVGGHRAQLSGTATRSGNAWFASPLALLLLGDRQAVLGVTLRLAEGSGIETGRLQLLLLEFREAVAARALEEHALAFPDEHPFWGQFTADEGRQVAAVLGSLGYHFDGRGGWADGRAPSPRDLALALNHAGFDARSLRRPAGQAAIDGLWQGTTVLVEDYLLARAPELSLTQVSACLDARAARLGDLWDNWGRLRPLLVADA